MRVLITYRSVAVFAVIVSGMVGLSIWFLSNGNQSHLPPVVPASATPEPPRPEVVGKPEVSPTAVATLEPPPDPVSALTASDRKIDEILRRYPGNSELDHINTAQSLINLLPALKGESQVECVQHISNLLPDKEYHRFLHIWRNPSANRDVIELVAADLMNRDHKVMLPAMLDALKLPTHPLHDEAKANLQLFLNGDYGNDFAKWDAAVKNLLREEEQARQAAADRSRQGAPSTGPQR